MGHNVMPQLAFSWPATSNYTPEDFITSPTNSTAASFIEIWPDARQPAALLTGPVSCGKTHLAYLWMQRTGGIMLDPATLGTVPSDMLFGVATHAVLRNIETLAPQEEAFFHLLRYAENTTRHLLLTSRLPVRELPFKTPDVRSRLLALPLAQIQEPDDDLLRAYFTKCFADRQWRISASVINFLVLRTERSFAAAQAILAKLEQLIATTKRDLTIPQVKLLIE